MKFKCNHPRTIKRSKNIITAISKLNAPNISTSNNNKNQTIKTAQSTSAPTQSNEMKLLCLRALFVFCVSARAVVVACILDNRVCLCDPNVYSRSEMIISFDYIFQSNRKMINSFDYQFSSRVWWLFHVCLEVLLFIYWLWCLIVSCIVQRNLIF